ncbi:hypothetical protein GCM10009665_22180 [Kitasatospora nipponensis]|uniref:Uncharacterized protein n=1 Tax=Kitasatospora nipponensis TaxID=258049 RepID=A0ABN1W1M6_9ACTN
MTVFVCSACGLAITGPLTELTEMPARPGDQGYRKADGSRRATATMPLGFFAREPEPWGAPLVPTDECREVFPGGPCLGDPDGDRFLVSAGPRNTVVLHPDDARGLRKDTDCTRHSSGCCGLHGHAGMNRQCPCGAHVGTLINDCNTAYELHLEPTQVRLIAD